LGQTLRQIFYELDPRIAEGLGRQRRRGTNRQTSPSSTAAPRIWDLPWSEE
jgi:hypothetical protein